MFTRSITFVRRLWSAAPVATVVLAIALAAALFFGARAAIFWHHGPPWIAREQTVAAWMTPRYIVRSWRIPPRVLMDAIKVPDPRPKGPLSLSELAVLRGVSAAQVIAEAEAAIAAFQADKDRPDADTAGEPGHD